MIDYQEIIKEMLKDNLSIRDMAKKYDISKSKLHRELTREKVRLAQEDLDNFNKHLEQNKKKGKKKRG